MKKAVSIVVLIICCLFLTSCYDSTEADEKNYAVVVGIDKNSSGGYIYTVLCPEFKEESSPSSPEGSTSPEGYAVYSLDADNLNHAVTRFSSTSSKTLSLAQVKAFVISSGINDKTSLVDVTDDIFNHHERTFGAYVMMSEGSASEFLENATYSTDGNIPSEFVNMIKQSAYNGLSVNMSFIDFYTDLVTEKTVYLPKCSLDTTTIKSPVKCIINGIYLFDENNDFVVLEKEETAPLLLATNKISNLNFNSNGIDATLTSTKPPVLKSTVSGGELVSVIDVFLDGKIYSDKKSIDEAKAVISKEIADSIIRLYKNYSNKKGIDIFSLRQHIKRRFLSVDAYNSYPFFQSLSDSHIKVNINLSLRSAL